MVTAARRLLLGRKVNDNPRHFIENQRHYSAKKCPYGLALTIWTSVGRVMSLLFNTLSRFVIVFPPRSKHLLISWLQSPSTMILEPKKRKSVTASTFSPSICHVVMGLDAIILVFLIFSFKLALSLSSFIKRLFISSSSRDYLASLQFLSLEWYHLHI